MDSDSQPATTFSGQPPHLNTTKKSSSFLKGIKSILSVIFSVLGFIISLPFIILGLSLGLNPPSEEESDGCGLCLFMVIFLMFSLVGAVGSHLTLLGRSIQRNKVTINASLILGLAALVVGFSLMIGGFWFSGGMLGSLIGGIGFLSVMIGFSLLISSRNDVLKRFIDDKLGVKIRERLTSGLTLVGLVMLVGFELWYLFNLFVTAPMIVGDFENLSMINIVVLITTTQLMFIALALGKSELQQRLSVIGIVTFFLVGIAFLGITVIGLTPSHLSWLEPQFSNTFRIHGLLFISFGLFLLVALKSSEL